MRRINPRLLIGLLFVVGGILALLDVQGLISNAGGIFWGLIFASGALVFLYLLFTDRANRWAAFPGFTLLGLAASSFLSGVLEPYDGLAFFAGLSLAFWWMYFTDRGRWQMIIPAGILLTLGVVSALDDIQGIETGGILFLGLGLTFLLTALLPGDGTRSWALIVGAVLLLFGVLLGVPSLGVADYFWPVALILLGGFFVFQFLRQSRG